eukprot:PhF_6_TR24011/c0_g1_i1/m.33618
MGQQQSAEDDLKAYLTGYPDLVDDRTLCDNANFFLGKIRCVPDGLTFDELVEQWSGNYDQLEEGHSYIQWIFPIREQGLNPAAHPLQLHEIMKIRGDAGAQRRVIMGYKMMLDFYGFKLVDERTGTLEPTTDCDERFLNLCTFSHNFLRITRILKSLGELGFEHLKFPLLEQFSREVFVTKRLRRCRDSLMRYWAPTLRNAEERQRMLQQLEELSRIDETVQVPSSDLGSRMESDDWEVPTKKPSGPKITVMYKCPGDGCTKTRQLVLEEDKVIEEVEMFCSNCDDDRMFVVVRP